MLTKRHGAILELLEGRGALSPAILATELSVSAETIRRDVRALVEAGAAVRVDALYPGSLEPHGPIDFKGIVDQRVMLQVCGAL